MKRFALPIVILAVCTAACSSGGAVGAGNVANLVPPPKVVPNSIVRLDPKTLKPLQVVPVGSAPDLAIDAGGYIWVTHYILRDQNTAAIRNGGDRTLARVDPSTGKTTVVGGGLAPCGVTADPSGDVWVANCYPRRSGQSSDIVRVDAKTLRFKATWPAGPAGGFFFRGIGYGGGSVWVEANNAAIRINPDTGAQRSIHLPYEPGAFAWDAAHGDLWTNNGYPGSLTRLHVKNDSSDVVRTVLSDPVFPAVAGDTVWAADWNSPQVLRVAITGSRLPRSIKLPVNNPNAGVWNVAVGAGYIWATTPRDGTLWRINPHTYHVTRINMPYLPTGVTAGADGVWVTVRGY
jgi:streptogramin lyase